MRLVNGIVEKKTEQSDAPFFSAYKTPVKRIIGKMVKKL